LRRILYYNAGSLRVKEGFMPVENLQCPNCGAQIDFAGGTTATCSFCNSRLTLTGSGVTATSALSDLADGSVNLAGVDLERIQQLVRDGKKIEAIKLVREQTDLSLKDAKDAVEAIERGEKPALSPRRSASVSPHNLDLAPIQDQLLRGNKIEAIKLYREQTGVGLKDAKDAVEAIERGELPTVTTDLQRTASPSALRRSSRFGCLFGCLPTLFFIGLCAGFIMLSSQVMFRVWGPLDQALNIVNHNEAVTNVFGQPVTVGPFITGKVSSGGNSSVASLDVPLYGPKNSGDLSVSGSWRRGVWALSIWVTYEEDGEEQTIYIEQQSQ
jgi:ribosomal protein L7/L12